MMRDGACRGNAVLGENDAPDGRERRRDWGAGVVAKRKEPHARPRRSSSCAHVHGRERGFSSPPWTGLTEFRFPAIAMAMAMAVPPLSACDFMAGPLAQASGELRSKVSPGRSLEIPECGTLSIESAVLDRMVASGGSDGMFVSATVDLEGAFAAGGPRVSYLGVEKVPLVQTSAGVSLAGSSLPALDATLTLMCRRRKAVLSGSADELSGMGFPKARESESPVAAGKAGPSALGTEGVRRWIVRTTADGATVLEERENDREKFNLKRVNGGLRPTSL